MNHPQQQTGIVAGLIAYGSMKVQNFPDLDLPTVTATASLPGASPTQLETDVARKICIEYGSTATICKGRTGAQVKQWGIHGTTTKAIAIGQAVDRKSTRLNSSHRT